MAIHMNAGSKIFISPATVNSDNINGLSDQDAITLFEAINDWVEIEEVEDMGTIGDSAEDVTFTAVGNRRVRHLKGSKDAGTQTLTCGRDPLDDGQIELAKAEKTDFDYAFRITLNDARTANHTNSTIYYAGKVMSNPTNLGSVSNVVRREFTVGVGTAVIEVASSLIAGAPVNNTPPTISGTAEVGQTLTASNGSWAGSPISYTYQWQSDDGTGWANIAGATNATYVPVSGDIGDTIRVQVTATNGSGSTTASSAATSAVV